jgi:hypothetical protein
MRSNSRGRRRKRAVGLVLTASMAAGYLGGGGAAQAEAPDEITAAQTVAAVEQVDPTGTQVADLPAPDAAGDVTATTNGGTVEIPKDPADGITMSVPGEQPVQVGLPGAARATDARTVGDTVVYEGAAPSVDIAVQVTAGGGVRQLLTLAGPDAPKSYSFPVDMPDGAVLSLTSNGGAQVTKDGALVTSVAPGWARDAEGAEVPTRYTVDGSVLTQHIDTDAADVYPIIADPIWIAGWVIYNVGYRCGIGASGALLLYRLYAEGRSMSGYFTTAAVSCVTSGLGIRRIWSSRQGMARC